MNKNKILTLAAIIIVLLGYFAWKERVQNSAPEVTGTAATSSVFTSTTTSSGLTVGGTGNYTITEIPNNTAPQTPDYKTPLVCASDVPADQCAVFKSTAATLSAGIAQNPNEMKYWINLGTIRKDAEDYQGAIAAWNYAASRLAENPIPYANMADLYANFLHDNAKAEANYLKAIAIYPSSIDFHVALARLYKSDGRAVDAKAQYDAAIKLATSQNQPSLATQLQSESSSTQ